MCSYIQLMSYASMMSIVLGHSRNGVTVVNIFRQTHYHKQYELLAKV